MLLDDIPRQLLRDPAAMTKLGVRSVLRMSQTFLNVYPRALLCLLQRRLPEPAELRELFESLGATYIKFGQLIASSPSVFPKAYVDEFQKLLDQTDPVSFARIKRTVEADLERSLPEVFEFFDEQPLACASIAQVHGARLTTGEDVVVKVQKPGVQTTINIDMNACYLFFRVVELMMPGADRESMSGVVAELYQAMIDECDFRKEAENLLAFRRYLGATGNTRVIAPRPYPQASGIKVLTMERLYGRPLTDLANLQHSKTKPADIVTAAMKAWFGSLLQCESFHADLHNGNMLVLDTGQVGFIDFGMVGRITPEIWQAAFQLIAGLSEKQYRVVAEAMLAIGMTRKSIDVTRLALEIEQVFEVLNALDPELAVSQVGQGSQIDHAISQLGEIARRYGLRFPRAFTLLLKQFLYFDRYIQLLAPDIDIFEQARQF